MDQVARYGLSSASHWILTRVFHHCSCRIAKHHHLHHLHHSEHQSQHKTYYMLGINLRTLSGLTHLLFITDALRWFLIAFQYYSHRGTCIHRAQHHKISKHWSQAQTLWPLFLTTMLSSSSINKEIGTQRGCCLVQGHNSCMCLSQDSSLNWSSPCHVSCAMGTGALCYQADEQTKSQPANHSWLLVLADSHSDTPGDKTPEISKAPSLMGIWWFNYSSLIWTSFLLKASETQTKNIARLRY